MKPRERRETGKQDLFRSQLDQIIDTNHPLAKLAQTVDWRFLEGRFGEVYTDDPGHPPLPTRLMAGLAILKHTYDLSEEVLCERWVENPYYPYFCGEEFFQHRLVFDRSSMTLWRNRMGEGAIAGAAPGKPQRFRDDAVAAYFLARISRGMRSSVKNWLHSPNVRQRGACFRQKGTSACVSRIPRPTRSNSSISVAPFQPRNRIERKGP